KVNGLAADSHAVHPPAIAVPEALALPVAGAANGAADVGRPAVVAVARSVIARTVVVGTVIIRARRDRTADNGASKQAGRDTHAEAALGLRGRGHGRNRERGDGGSCHQCLSHAVTFLREAKSQDPRINWNNIPWRSKVH